MADDEMTCREVVELVNDYLEGVLPPLERTRFEGHLDECPGCEAYLEQIRVTIAAVGRPTPESLDPAVLEGLLQAFRARASER